MLMTQGHACSVDTATPADIPHRSSYVLVMDQHTLVGIFTERDVVRLSAQGSIFTTLSIAEVMIRQLVTLSDTDSLDLESVLTLFRLHQIRHLPILDGDAKVLGVITTSEVHKALQPSTLLKMRTVQEVMTNNPVTARPTTPVMEIAQLMATHHISCVVIVQVETENARPHPIGIITERDIVQYQILEENMTQPAQAVMSSPLECLTVDDTLWQAQQTMQKLRVRRLVVTNAQGSLQGILTQSSMLSVLNVKDMCNTLEILQQQVDQLQNEKIQLLQSLNATLEHQVEEDTVVLNSCQNFFTATFEQAAIGIAHVDLDGQFLAVNQWFCDLLQYNSNDLLQRSFLEITHPEDRAEDQRQVQQLIKNNRAAFKREKRYLRRDGSVVWGKVTVSLAQSEVNLPDYLIAVVEDISDRKRAELALQQLNQELEERVIRSTAAYRASEQRYRTLFESAPDMLFVLSQEGIIQQVNAVTLARSGYSETDLLNQPISTFLATVSQPASQLFERLRNHGTFREVSRLYCQNGISLFVDCAYSLIHDEQGHASHILVIQRDISEQIQTAAALKTSEARYRLLYQNTPVMLHSIDQRGRLVSVSNTWLTKMGYERSEVIGRASTDFLSPTSQIYTRQKVLPQFFQTGTCQDIPYQLVTKQGDMIDVLLSAFAERDDQGNLIRTLAVSIDVTERNRIETALRESEERFRLAFEKAAIGMAIVSPTGKWLKVNASLCDIVGYSEAQLLTMTFQDITHPDDIALDLQASAQLLKGEIDNYHTQKRYIHQQGHIVWISLSASLVFRNDGRPLHFITQIENISARKVSEQKLSESLAEKNVMLQEIHHRVKNNLQVICSLLNLQTQANPDIEIAEIMQESQNRVKSMALVHENLYQSQDLSKINLANYIKELTNNLLRSYRSRASLTQIKIDISHLYLNIDTAIPCGLIINELVSNALKYAFPEDIRGNITIHIFENTPQELTLTVSDDGIGLPEDISTDNVQTLGLRMANTLTRQISGNLTIDRKTGTTFQICFPQPLTEEKKVTPVVPNN